MQRVKKQKSLFMNPQPLLISTTDCPVKWAQKTEDYPADKTHQATQSQTVVTPCSVIVRIKHINTKLCAFAQLQ
jgi:hypothetical protein